MFFTCTEAERHGMISKKQQRYIHATHEFVIHKGLNVLECIVTDGRVRYAQRFECTRIYCDRWTSSLYTKV